jgi:capsular polysaccharide biosynthesis protein
MELRRYFALLRRRVVLVALTVIAGLAAGFTTTSREPIYTAQATLYIGARQYAIQGLPQGVVSNDLLAGLQQVIQTFSFMIRSQPIATDALERTGINRSPAAVVGQTKAVPEPNTQLLRVQVQDPDPGNAQRLANGVADAFVEKIGEFEPSTAPGPGSLPQLPAYVYERASLPTVPAPTGLARRTILGGLFGLVAAVAVAFLLEYLDVSIKTAEDAERKLELKVLGVIPQSDELNSPRPVRAPAAARVL